MSRPTTKTELLNAADKSWKKLNTLIASLTEEELTTPFAFPESKKEAHWKRDRNLRDVLVHLHEWHELLLRWIAANRAGESKPFLPAPYNWKTYGLMNVVLWQKHQNTSLEDAKRLLADSHAKVMRLAQEFSDEELFQRGAFPWVGGSTLGSYFTSNTASHYEWAMKKLKAHVKNCREKNPE